MERARPFQGIYSALPTPFSTSGEINLPLLLATMNWQLTSEDKQTPCVDGFVLYGTTGEAPTLSLSERELITRSAVQQFPQTPLIAGVGSNCTQTSIMLAQQAHQWGATAGLVVTPYYNRPSQEGIYQHVCRIADATPDWPLVIYVVPGRTSIHLDVETVHRILTRCPQVISVKDATADLSYCAELISCCQDRASVLSGDDPTAWAAWSLGAQGSISVCSNLCPHDFCMIWQAYLDGNFDDGRARFRALAPLIRLLFIESNPSPLKAALAWRTQHGLVSQLEAWSEDVRLPLTELSRHSKSLLFNELARYFGDSALLSGGEG